MTPLALRTGLVALPLIAAALVVVSRPPADPLVFEPGRRPVLGVDSVAALPLRAPALHLDPPAEAARNALRQERLARFNTLLSDLRRGHTQDPSELLECADQLGRDHGRDDTRDIAAFFVALTPEQRLQGWEDRARCLELHQRVQALSGEDWVAAARTLAGDLAAFVDGTRERADFTPAAWGLDLLAQVELSLASVGNALAGLDGELAESTRAHALESIELYRRASQITPQLAPLYTVGELERKALRLAEARRHFERCRSLATRVGQEGYREWAILALLRIARDTGDTSLVEFGLRDWARFRDPDQCWPLVKDYALLLLHADRPEAALVFLERYPPDEASAAAAHGLLVAAVLRRMGHMDAAREAYAAIEELGEEPLGRELHRLAQADLALASDEPQRVLEILAQDEIEAFTAKGQVDAYTRIGEALLAQERPERARRWLRAALDLADDWQEHHSQSSGSVKGEWIGLHSVVRLAQVEGSLGEHAEVARLIEDHQSFRLRSNRDGVGIAQIEDWAQRYELGLITWAIGPDHSIVATVANDLSAWSATIHCGRRAVEAAVARLNQAILAGDESRADVLAREIAAALVPASCPLRARVGRADERLLVLVHGPLENLSLTRLELDGRALDEVLTAVVLPGLPGGDALDEAPSFARGGGNPPWTFLGGPVDGSGRSLLPGADSEIQVLAQCYPRARVFAGSDFDRFAVEAALAGDGPLHVATHLVESGVCNGSRLAPVGLLLSHGEVFCAEEVLALGPRLPLVLLTTCESGGGRFIDAEGLHGLGRAFLEGGTRNLLATLWPIDDQAARRFSLHLHEGLLAGKLPSRAARAARAALRREGFPAADWAAFRFLGRD